MRRIAVLCALLLFVGCQQPFGGDRHDLEGFRIAAVNATPGGGITGDLIEAEAIVVQDSRLWSDEAPELHWVWSDTALPSAIAALLPAESDAIGPAPSLTIPYSNANLVLIATHPDGAQRRAILPIPDQRPQHLAPTPEGIQVLSTGMSMDSVTATDLELEARTHWQTHPAEFVPEGHIGRLRAVFSDPPEDGITVRWMATGPFGTFLETDSVTTDWMPANAHLEEDSWVIRDPLPPGVRSLVASVIHPGNANATRISELWIDTPAPGIWTPGGRWLATDVQWPETTLVEGTLIADDLAPTGLALHDTRALLPNELAPLDPYGTETLACEARVEGPFDPDWLATGRCLRAAVVGAVVVLETR